MPACKTCKKYFASDYSLKRHVRNIHDKEESEEDESDEETDEFMTTEDEVETIGTIIKEAMVEIANKKASDEDEEEEEVDNTSNTSDQTVPNSVEDITEDEDKYLEIFNKFKEIVSQYFVLGCVIAFTWQLYSFRSMIPCDGPVTLKIASSMHQFANL